MISIVLLLHVLTQQFRITHFNACHSGVYQIHLRHEAARRDGRLNGCFRMELPAVLAGSVKLWKLGLTRFPVMLCEVRGEADPILVQDRSGRIPHMGKVYSQKWTLF